jgi:DNA replication protein DnaC
LKALTLRQALPWPLERAHADGWSYAEFLAAFLEREVTARAAHGGELRVEVAKFPARKSLEKFDFSHASGIKRDQVAHLGTLDFITAKENVIFLDPPDTGKTHLARGSAIKACHAGHRVEFATAADRVTRLANAHHGGRFPDEIKRLSRIPLLVIDEIGHPSFEPEATNLSFRLASARYERASLIVTSTKSLSRWGEVFGDDTIAAAIIDWIARPSCRNHRHQRRLLLPQGPRHRPNTTSQQSRINSQGAILNSRPGVHSNRH